MVDNIIVLSICIQVKMGTGNWKPVACLRFHENRELPTISRFPIVSLFLQHGIDANLRFPIQSFFLQHDIDGKKHL